jgi:hypothetical protein
VKKIFPRFILCGHNPIILILNLFLCGLLVGITGCSVGMALSGKKDPNLGALRVGATRGEVELQLGNPVSSVTTEDGKRVDIYEYEIGNEPSAGRAIAHGVMDILTWGLWEVVGTPVEGLKGNKYQISIAYDSDNRVIAINQPLASLPPANKNTSDKSNLITKSTVQSTKQSNDDFKTVEDKLLQLKTLKEKGIITEDEYNQMRKNTLDNATKTKETDILGSEYKGMP